MFLLKIVWETGEKESYIYKTEEEAESAGRNFKQAFGNQVSYYVSRKII